LIVLCIEDGFYLFSSGDVRSEGAPLPPSTEENRNEGFVDLTTSQSMSNTYNNGTDELFVLSTSDVREDIKIIREENKGKKSGSCLTSLSDL
jgi:hypothetical protein